MRATVLNSGNYRIADLGGILAAVQTKKNRVCHILASTKRTPYSFEPLHWGHVLFPVPQNARNRAAVCCESSVLLSINTYD